MAMPLAERNRYLTMDAQGMRVRAMCALMEIVSRGEWRKESSATQIQAELWVRGVRDGRIADVTIQAGELSHSLSVY